MPERTPDVSFHSEQYQVALSRWDNEGGAGPVDEIGDALATAMDVMNANRRFAMEPFEFRQGRVTEEAGRDAAS